MFHFITISYSIITISIASSYTWSYTPYTSYTWPTWPSLSMKDQLLQGMLQEHEQGELPGWRRQVQQRLPPPLLRRKKWKIIKKVECFTWRLWCLKWQIVDAIKKAFDNLQRITMTYNETAYTYVHIFDLYAIFFSLTSIWIVLGVQKSMFCWHWIKINLI